MKVKKKNKYIKKKSVEDSLLKIPHTFDYILLTLAFLIAFYIRAIIPHDVTFSHNMVGFASDDAVYHMRLVENLVQNFPNKIWFEPFTKYPFGQPLHFGPLLTYTIATVSLIIGLGNPTLTLTQTIGAYYPVVIGSLLIIPTYVITHTLFSRKTAIFASFLVILLPGQILNRSTLGFTDHHIGEVFFSSLFLMFFILALKSTENINITELKKHGKPHKSVIYSILAGLFFSLYMLQWPSGVFFGGIVSIFIIIQFTLNHLKNKSNEILTAISTLTLLSSSILITPFFNTSRGFTALEYSWLHIIITLGLSILFLILGKLSSILSARKIDKTIYPIILIFGTFISILITKLTTPALFNSFTMFFNIFSVPIGGQSTIAEARSPTREMILNNYPAILGPLTIYHIAFIAIMVLTISVLYKYKPEKGLFLIWSVIIFFLTTGQNRWFYYYSFNVAILVSFLSFSILDKMNFTKFTNNIHDLNPITEQSISTFINNKFNILHIVSIFLLIYLLLLPCYNISRQVTTNGVVSFHMGYYEWRDAMYWMKDNTPPTGLDFNTTYSASNFTYPSTSYGVMSWWDYGHVITYYAQRIPNANPFQHGIGGGPFRDPGASSFFTAQTEEESVEIANLLGTKYVISDAYMAYSINDIMAVWCEDTADYRQWANIPQAGGDQYTYSDRWYSNVEAKLHIFDTSGLSHFRLIYETIPNPNTVGGSQELYAKYIYNLLYSQNTPITNSGYVKIFEYVPGATITGHSPTDTNINIYLLLNSTKNNRTFLYTHSTVAKNNTFNITVPYSTIPNQEINPLSEYLFTENGNTTKTIKVSEENIINGDIIYV